MNGSTFMVAAGLIVAALAVAATLLLLSVPLIDDSPPPPTTSVTVPLTPAVARAGATENVWPGVGGCAVPVNARTR